MKVTISKFKALTGFVICCAIQCVAVAQGQQEEKLRVGERVPNYLLHNISYYSRNNASVSDFEGKWLFLDFWSSNCVSCVESFSKINRLQQNYGQNVQFVLIGKDDNYIRPMYEKFRVKLNLDIPICYDTVLFEKLDIIQVPYIIVVDPNQIVRAITVSITAQNIEDLLQRKEPVLAKALNGTELEEKIQSFNNGVPLLVNGNGGDEQNFLFRSVLADWKPAMPQYASRFMNPNGNMVQVTGMKVSWLYEMAYGDTVPEFPLAGKANSYGKYWIEPVLYLHDSSKFYVDFTTGKNLFSYSLAVPIDKATKLNFQHFMKNDLKNYFGYNAWVEVRKMPCWKLKAVNDNVRKALLTQSSTSEISKTTYLGQTGKSYKNVPVSQVISDIWYYHQMEIPFVDETGIEGNIDITIDALMTDLTDIRRALLKNGLLLVKGKKEMKVIVISDKTIK